MTTNIIVVGVAGQGKSALCNTVSRSVIFEEGESSSTITRENQSTAFTIDDKQAIVVDTIGLDDVNLSTTRILQEISRGCREMLNGRVHNLFYVIGGRITPTQVQQLDEIQQTIFTPGIKAHTTVIRTKFTRFQETSSIADDEAALRRDLPNLFQLCAKMLYVDNDPEDRDDKRTTSANRLRTYISLLSNSPPEAITPSPISFEERDETRRRAEEEQRIRQERERAELERRRQEEQRRQAAEIERKRREQEEITRRHQENMARERQAIEQEKQRLARELASMGAARSTGGAVREYQVQSTSTGKFFKLSGNGSFHISGEALHLSGSWTMSQQDHSFGGGLETVVGDVKDLNMNGNININSSLNIRNLTMG